MHLGGGIENGQLKLTVLGVDPASALASGTFFSGGPGDAEKLIDVLTIAIGAGWDSRVLFTSSMDRPEEHGWPMGADTPREFFAAAARRAMVRHALMQLSFEERASEISRYCRGCGSVHPRYRAGYIGGGTGYCQCENDE